MMSIRRSFVSYIRELQDEICDAFEELDGTDVFREDEWTREEGGGGVTRIMEDGALFEKAGVNVSEVHGDLPVPIKKKFGVDDDTFFAAGLSLVLHPQNPKIPTVHANFRYFELYEDEVSGTRSDAWFGGGIDLTPYHLFESDVEAYHRTLKEVCDPHGEDLYPRFKAACDEYFYLDHREEARGVGGLFFDYLRANEERTREDWYQFTTDIGKVFLDAYVPIVRRRRGESYTDRERYFQKVQRGRYVEFNLVYDRGTLFGLKTQGRTESILMSLPPHVRWDYDFEPEDGTPEAELKHVLRNPRDWV